jgi:15-hydroxyprostaglandin dehydrogenase (NAD)
MRLRVCTTPMALSLAEDVVAELRKTGAILRPDAIAACVVELIELIEYDSRAGAVVRVTVRGGKEYVVMQ